MILIAGYALLLQTFLTSHVFVLCLLIISDIATGLAMCRFGGVISTQKVLFLTLFKIGSKYFLCTNHIN